MNDGKQKHNKYTKSLYLDPGVFYETCVSDKHRDISNRGGIWNFRLLVVQPLYTMT